VSEVNGRATLRDIMTIQEKMFTEIQALRNEIDVIKIKVYVNAAIVGVVGTVLVNIAFSFIKFK